jgi:6-phosphogluconolactonase
MRSLFLTFILICSFAARAQQYYLFIGTYTDKTASKGIYVYRFDVSTGEAAPVSTAAAENPSYLALAPGGKFLYAVNETSGQNPGAVSAFAFDGSTGGLRFLDKQTSGGDDPCYVSVDAGRKWVMVANYSGGSLAAFPVRADGSLAPATELIQHTGSGPNKVRQEKAHVHSAIFDPQQQHLMAADLGMDKLSVYNFDAGARRPLTAPTDSTIKMEPGSGPRHFAFSPGKPYLYVLNELQGMVDVFKLTDGKYAHLQRISSHPAGYQGEIGSADIHIAPGGRFLYASNRGDANSIAIFSIDGNTGRLTVQGFQPTLGKTPRNFTIDPGGHWLLAANQNSGNISVFRIDQKTGLLKDSGKEIKVPAPVCLVLLPSGSAH